MIALKLKRQLAQQSHLTAWLKLSLALMSVSFAPIFIRFSETELGANATVLNRLLLFTLVFGVGRALTSQFKSVSGEPEPAPPPLTKSQYLLLVAVGLTSVTTLGLWAVSLEYTSVAKSMLLNNLTPVFTSLGAWIVFGKRFDARFLIGMTIALGGAVALGLEDLQGSADNLWGDCLALASAVFLGIYFLLVEQLRDRCNATTILLWRCSVGSLLLLPIVWWQESQFFPATLEAGLAVIGLALISEGLGQRLLADCMEQLSSSFVSLFLLLEPIVSAILAWVIFAEAFSNMTWVGFAIILTGIYLAQSSHAAVHEA